MPRKPVEKLCCVCLNSGLNLKRLSKKDEDNINLQTKLTTCIREVEWIVSYQICEQCTNLLNIAYAFRKTCLNSDIIRKEKQLKKEQVADEIKIEIEESIAHKGENKDIQDVASTSEDDSPNDSSGTEYESENEEYMSQKKYRNKEKKVQKKRRRKIRFACEKCQSTFPASTKLIQHCVKTHEMDSKDVKAFACERCPNRFSTSSNLLQHIKYHDGFRSNICSYCGSGFITKTDLINHEKQHLNRREYKCEACGKSFNTHKDIRSHRLIVHTDSAKWKYVCEICHKPFPIKSNYDNHMRRHTGDKQFACHLCVKKFTTKCDLQRHTRSHSHVREHQCKHCDKEYKDERVLKIHMAKVHGIGLGKVKIPVRERKYVCHLCPKAYYAKNKLTRHLYTHSGEKPFNCHVCNKKFNDKSYVKQHLKNTHHVDTSEFLEEELKIEYNNMTVTCPNKY